MPTHPLEALWAPITPDSPAGEDLSMAPELDEIRSARKGDDGGLSQGDWVRELRTPQWARIRELCESILKDRSKDLQVACWYAEALTMLEGFGGLTLGLQAVQGLLDRFWDSCHPALEGACAEARLGRIEWLDANLALAVKQIPLTAAGTGGYSWLGWEESRGVDNLGLRNPQAKEAAVNEGKLPGEVFQKAILASGPRFYQSLQTQVQAAREAAQALQASLGRWFQPEEPGLEALTEAIQNGVDFVAQTRQRHFPEASLDAPAGLPALEPERDRPASGPIRTRSEAILSLRTAAGFFRATEPHSPVALLVERAAAWAELPLDRWLAEVIKDAPTLAQLRELLNLKPEVKPAQQL